MIYVILGQTASGKTSLAISLAKKFSLPIISADAFQCYKEMNIGTDKPSKKEISGIKYHFFDELDVSEDNSVYYFQKEMRKVIDNYISEGKDIIVCGGTSFYIKSLLYNYKFNDSDSEKKYDDYSLDELKKLLLSRDKNIFDSIDNNNPRRIIRALEKLDLGIDINKIKDENDNNPIYPCIFFNLEVDKDIGNKLIDERVDLMFSKGLVKEVRTLLKKYPNHLNAFKAIGYSEFINLDNDEKIKGLIKIHSHQYAKKQRTFIKHQFDNVITATKEEIFNYISLDILLKKRTNLLFDGKTINRIEKSKVLLAGLGGVGSIVATSLVRMGFKNIYLIDYDKVEPTNLNRQLMYDTLDIGLNKTDVCYKKLKNISPLANIKTYLVKIKSVNDIPNIKFDVILDCIDFVDGKVSLYLKSKRDESIFISALGAGFHIDSTKFIYSTLNKASGPLAKNFISKLIEKGISKEEIDKIMCVYPTDSKLKNKENESTIPSIINATNASGLAIISNLLKIFTYKE